MLCMYKYTVLIFGAAQSIVDHTEFCFTPCQGLKMCGHMLELWTMLVAGMSLQKLHFIT